ncbi:hypothetical protein OCK02_05455 (plasmid) [Rhizobium sp. TRM96647]|uniref:hypothetical protein n=1 Tax=unclassified Rhizobium TaxID=2613769 RepID=UPI0021E78D28|nr:MULTISPECIES: hypothetical protein [unclassified Rhizobium]MCV3735645.1 hypothetical protein [Rhizobium sp. TRM96647]MCV3757592.1 hypothetical protein [Rhizobium sp. TRM96650]
MKIDSGRLTAYAYSFQQPRNFANDGDGPGRTASVASVGAPTVGPSLGTSGLASSLWTLKASEDSPLPSPRDEFLEWADMDPTERLRAQILQSMGISEDDLEAMSPEERAAVEADIRKAIEEKIGMAEDPTEAADDVAGTDL